MCDARENMYKKGKNNLVYKERRKNMRKICIAILLIIIMMLSGFTVVNAYGEGVSATFSLTTENKNVKVGDIVTINLVIDEIKGFSGIDTFRAVKNFDSTIFEYQGCVGQNGWSVKSDNTVSNKLTLGADNLSKEGIIAVFTFKVLKPVKDTTIALINLDASGVDNEYAYYEDGNVNSPSVSFKVIEEEKENPDTNTTPDTNTIPDTNTVPDTNTNKVNNDKTTAPGEKIPQTGETHITIALVFIGFVLAVIFYTKYKMYETK